MRFSSPKESVVVVLDVLDTVSFPIDSIVVLNTILFENSASEDSMLIWYQQYHTLLLTFPLSLYHWAHGTVRRALIHTRKINNFLFRFVRYIRQCTLRVMNGFQASHVCIDTHSTNSIVHLSQNVNKMKRVVHYKLYLDIWEIVKLHRTNKQSILDVKYIKPHVVMSCFSFCFSCYTRLRRW